MYPENPSLQKHRDGEVHADCPNGSLPDRGEWRESREGNPPGSIPETDDCDARKPPHPSWNPGIRSTDLAYPVPSTNTQRDRTCQHRDRKHRGQMGKRNQVRRRARSAKQRQAATKARERWPEKLRKRPTRPGIRKLPTVVVSSRSRDLGRSTEWDSTAGIPCPKPAPPFLQGYLGGKLENAGLCNCLVPNSF